MNETNGVHERFKAGLDRHRLKNPGKRYSPGPHPRLALSILCPPRTQRIHGAAGREISAFPDVLSDFLLSRFRDLRRAGFTIGENMSFLFVATAVVSIYFS